MSTILHILRSEPDETVEALVSALIEQEGATVVCLYGDSVNNVPVDWYRLLDDIFSHDRVICWW
jgi:NDP-sugar pyrophosphorylase family protein